jgi:hypothetical protein
MGEHPEHRVFITPWLSKGDLNLAEPLHEIPRKLENLLSKFDPNMPSSPEDHVKNLILVILVLNVQHEDVVCRIFTYTFAGRASTW